MDIVGGGRIDLSEAKRLIEKYDTDGDSQITYDGMLLYEYIAFSGMLESWYMYITVHGTTSN